VIHHFVSVAKLTFSRIETYGRSAPPASHPDESRLMDTFTKSERELLKAIYRLSDGAGHPEAHTGDIAERLGLSPSTVTTSIKRLADRDLVDHTPYKGAALTAAGRQVAVATIRRHRIVERFLADMLGYAWNEADRLAATFEHELPQEVEDRLYVALDRPGSCPHGFPIPAPEVAELPPLPPLYDLEPGDTAIVAVPGSTDPEVVSFLEQLGLRPGGRVEIKEKHPFDGPLVLVVDGPDGEAATRTLGATVANQVFVQRST
jgi:DtxR family transcriptional regulator, Mn-dependent transcriptional regulator